MELWGWIAGYVLLFVVLQVVLYYFYVNRENAPTTSLIEDGAADRASPSVEGSARSERESEPDVSGETIRCPHCGGRNEADRGFTYCRHCVSTLRR